MSAIQVPVFGDRRLPERFWAKVEIDPRSGCWLWTASITRDGYGGFRVGSRSDGSRRLALTHRLTHETLVGEVPDGFELDHLCRNPACCNPRHLEPVTHRENTLRGETVPAHNAAKTHCKHGHEFNEENTRVLKTGKRVCRACDRRRRAKYAARKQRKAKESPMRNAP